MAAQHGDDHRDQLATLLVDSVIDYAIFVLDPGGHVVSWNPGAERLKGYTREQIVGEHFSIFYVATDRDDRLPQELLRRAEQDGRVAHRGWRVRRDGSRFWGDVTITALRGDDGTLAGYAKVTRDLTDQHEAELAQQRALEQERRAARELAQIDEQRSHFLASLSHDLTTPVTVIRGSIAELAALGVDDGSAAELLGLVRRNADNLERMVGQLRELSRLQRGWLPLDPRPLAVREAVTACIDDLAVLLKGVEVEIGVSGHVEADALALRRILTNLVTNAAQHSPPGGRLSIVAEDRPGEVAIGVADEGPGVPPEEAETIFDEFRQGSTADRRSGGLGLGLSIVRRYVEQHGGRAWVASESARGATFWFTLPRAGTPDPR